MLILTRRSGEAICIGPEVEITVLDVSGDHVRIGINAPRQVTVLRKELRDEVESANRSAASPAARAGLRIVGGLAFKKSEDPQTR